MKTLKYVIIASTALLAVSCTKELKLDNTVDESKYIATITPTVSVRDDAGKAYFRTEEMYADKASIELAAGLTKLADNAVDVQFSIGTQADVDSFNKLHGTAYAMLPEGCATIDDKTITVDKGQTISVDKASLNVNLEQVAGEDFVTYVVPVVATSTTKGINVGDPFMVFVKDLRACPDNSKYVIGGEKQKMTIFNCTEAGSNNILNNLSFKLQNSGKYLIDVVLLFTNNVSFNKNTGEMEIGAKTGPDAQAGRQQTIIKELHAHGVKVLLCITNKGVTEMNKKSAQEFAKKAKQYIDMFNFDGIFLDDEYDDLPETRPDFLTSTPENGARLCYELRQVMPDKMIVNYLWETLTYTTDIAEVDGMPMKDIVDFALNDYGRSKVPTALPAAQVSMYSDNCSSETAFCTNNSKTCRTIMNGGYGAHFFYVLSPGRMKETNAMYKYVSASLNNICNIWFGDKLDFKDYNAQTEW